MKYGTVLALLILAPAWAQADETVLSILASSTGSWEGELYYLDYQSGQRFGIPMRIDAETTPDGKTLVRRLTYTDPGNLVYAVSLATVDRDTGELVEAFFRDGSAELLRYSITATDYSAADRWRFVYEQDGTDDDRPARIRHTMQRDGDVITSSKEVRFLDGDGQFFLRNGIEVRRSDRP